MSKMISVFGAPVAPDDATAMVDYLARNCGAGSG